MSRGFRSARVPRWFPEIIILAALYCVYDITRALVRAQEAAAITNGRTIFQWELAWHLSPERALNSLMEDSTLLAVLCSYYYAALHFIVTPAVLVWMFRQRFAAYRFARSVLVAGSVIGLIGFYLFPTAPPRLVPGLGISDTMRQTSDYGWWRAASSVPDVMRTLANEYAAMPSLHVGWALWCGVLIAVYARYTWVRVVGALYPLATTLVVIATGNHYLLDVLAGVVTMGAGWGLVVAGRSLLWALGQRGAHHESVVMAP